MNLFNFWAVLVAALVALPVGFIWYNPKVFGTAWMRSIGQTDEAKMKEGANMGLIFGMSVLYAIILASSIVPMVIHQMGLYSLLMEYMPGPDSKIEILLDGKSVEWMSNFRTFKHGMFHGAIASIFIVLPIIGTNALFERRNWKYVLINTGYWFVCMMLMGGIICAWK